MRYMLLMCDDGTKQDGLKEIVTMPEFVAWEQKVDERGVRHRGARLRPPGEAATVRVRDGELVVTDGPFAETKEQIIGYGIIECADRTIHELPSRAAKPPVTCMATNAATPDRAVTTPSCAAVRPWSSFSEASVPRGWRWSRRWRRTPT